MDSQHALPASDPAGAKTEAESGAISGVTSGTASGAIAGALEDAISDAMAGVASAARPGTVHGFRLRPKPMFKPKRIPKTRLKFKRKLRDCGEAEHQMCRAIAALGELAGIDVGMGRGPADMDSFLVLAAHQCNFDDAEFMDGPCCFTFVKTVVDADILKLQADVVVQGLVGYIRGHGGADAIEAAARQQALVDGAFAWLRYSVRNG